LHKNFRCESKLSLQLSEDCHAVFHPYIKENNKSIPCSSLQHSLATQSEKSISKLILPAFFSWRQHHFNRDVVAIRSKLPTNQKLPKGNRQISNAFDE
jgi:hypothetical protein